jgi:hypothetical protein
VLTVTMTITGRLFAVLTVIVTIMTIMGGIYAVLTVIATITGMSIFSVNIYCDNKWEAYMQC